MLVMAGDMDVNQVMLDSGFATRRFGGEGDHAGGSRQFHRKKDPSSSGPGEEKQSWESKPDSKGAFKIKKDQPMSAETTGLVRKDSVSLYNGLCNLTPLHSLHFKTSLYFKTSYQ